MLRACLARARGFEIAESESEDRLINRLTQVKAFVGLASGLASCQTSSFPLTYKVFRRWLAAKLMPVLVRDALTDEAIGRISPLLSLPGVLRVLHLLINQR